MRVKGLEDFGLNVSSLRRLGEVRVKAYLTLRTYDLTPAVKKLRPSLRHAYLIARVKRWIVSLRRDFPEVVLRTVQGKLLGEIRQKSDMPNGLLVQVPARMIVALATARGVRSTLVIRVGRLRRRARRSSELAWYCVRGFVTVLVEGATTGLQMTEERFVLVRAKSPDEAKKRLVRKWKEYANPYLNSDGQMVRWQLDRIVDVYDMFESEIDPAGTEVYSKIGRRRMRPGYVWRPKSR